MADASFVSRLLEPRTLYDATDESGSILQSSRMNGIFKIEWSTKHYRRRPAVVIVFLDRRDVIGDPQKWTRVSRQIDTVRYLYLLCIDLAKMYAFILKP